MKLITISCLATCLLPLVSATAASTKSTQTTSKPNIIFFFADDLGYGELGVYGQKKIKTPNIDQLAREGMRFTQFYSGQNVCAPSRCSLLTGKHMGHAAIRENSGHLLGKPETYSDPDMRAAAARFVQYKKEDGFPGQLLLPKSELTIATILKKQGYTTACIGKWGLGHVSDEGSPNRHGFDLFATSGRIESRCMCPFLALRSGHAAPPSCPCSSGSAMPRFSLFLLTALLPCVTVLRHAGLVRARASLRNPDTILKFTYVHQVERNSTS